MITSTDLPITTVSLLRFEGWKNQTWAFVQMGRGPGLFKQVAGLRFVKLLGSGDGEGFNRLPNFGVYAFLGSWDHAGAAEQFFNNHPVWQGFRQHTANVLTVYLDAMKAHGQWDGREPFTPTVAHRKDGPVAVITRATIYPHMVPRFWKYVAPVSAAIQKHPEHLLSIGIGELPWFVQATFSLWTSAEAMREYAYQQPQHLEVVRKTRELGWYKEELFARFRPNRLEGSWPGRDITQLAEALGITAPSNL